VYRSVTEKTEQGPNQVTGPARGNTAGDDERDLAIEEARHLRAHGDLADDRPAPAGVVEQREAVVGHVAGVADRAVNEGAELGTRDRERVVEGEVRGHGVFGRAVDQQRQRVGGDSKSGQVAVRVLHAHNLEPARVLVKSYRKEIPLTTS
jgi:hypothetical protein